MIRRVWNAYRIEMTKAARIKFTYAGAMLVIVAVLCTPLARPLSRDGVSDYAFIAYATPLAVNVLGLFVLLVFCAGLVVSEVGSGSIRMVLTRPLRRGEFIAAKLMLGMTYAVLLTLCAAAASWTIALVFGELRGVSFGGEVVYTSNEMVRVYLAGVFLSLFPLFAAAGFAVMMSSLTRSASASIGGTIGLWILIDIVKHPLHAAPFVFSTYLEDPWHVFASQCDGMDASWFPRAWYMIGASALSLLAFSLVAGAALSRRNLRL